jgi:hypothetical protein
LNLRGNIRYFCSGKRRAINPSEANTQQEASMQTQLRNFAALPISLLLVSSWSLAPRAVPTVSAETSGRITPTGNTLEPRFDHTATLLRNGKVLIAAGGARNGVIEPTAELYDPQTGKFSAAGKMQSPRGWGVAAVLLPSGKVLFAGGSSASYCDASCSLATAELYDPASGAFNMTGNMTTPRAGANSILLPDGDVLIAGGNDVSSGDHLATAELYHPRNGTFSSTGSMHSGGASTLVLLNNGKVLAVEDSSMEIYDSATGQFSVAGSAVVGRSKFGSTLLPDGRLLIAGGQVGGAWGPKSPSTNIYDPASGSLAPGPKMNFDRFKLKKAVVPLDHGQVLIAGGAAQPEIYDVASNSFRPAQGSQLDSYYFSTATRLTNGNVLIVGGYAKPGGPAFNHAWLYEP